MFSFGFSSCWNSGPQSSLSILLLLKKPDLSLDELLNDDDILTELKTVNQNLINFLTKPENFETLIDMAISEPVCSEDDLDFKKYCKLPYIACEMLIADCPAIISTFSDSNSTDNEEKPIENKDYKYFDQLFAFLDKEQLNYTNAGYFSKIVTVLLEKKPTELLFYLYKKHPEHFEKLVNHISSESVAELLFKLLTFESTAINNRLDSAYETKMTQVLKLLSQKLETPTEREISKNAAYVISNVFGKSQTMHNGSEVLSGLLDSESIEEFFRILKKKDAASVSAAAVVLGNIFDYYIHISPPENEENKLLEDYKPESKLKSDLPIAVITIENIPSIVSLIAEANDATAPLGNFRLKLIDFVNIVMETNNLDINAAISKSEFFKVILEMCIRFEWHSILHNQVEKIIIAVVDSKFEDLKSSLFENAQVFSVIVGAFEDSKTKVLVGNRGKTVRKGYLGQLIRIANKIAQSTDSVVLRYTEKDGAWKEFVHTKLAAINEIRTMKLGDKQEAPENHASTVADEIKFDKPTGLSKSPSLQTDQQIEQQNVPATLKKSLPPKRNRTEKNLFGIKCVKKAEVKIPIVEPEPEVIPTPSEIAEAKSEPDPEINQPKQKEVIKTVPGFKSFYSIFNFSPKGLTSIHAMLQKGDITINELLNDETLIKETRSVNKELLKFLTKEENFKQLINHVILEPSIREQESNFQQCCKFPFIASEVLSSGCSAIANAFLNYNAPDKEKTSLENRNQKFLDQLFSFLDNHELNPTATGYFTKILSSVFEKKPCAFVACMYKKRPEYLDKMVNHINSESIAELLLRLLTFESTVLDDTLDDTYHTKVIHILKMLSQKLNTPNEIQTTKNAAYVISEVLGKSQSIHKGSEVVDSLLDPASVEGYFRILKTKDTGSVAAAAIVLGNIFDYYIHINTTEQPDTGATLKSDLPIVSATLKNMQSIINLIADVQGPNLGSFRLKLIDFVSIAIETRNLEINAKIAKCEFFKVILKLFLNFEWHNILHSQIEQIIAFVIEGDSDELKLSLFENAKIIDIILDSFDENKVLTPAGKRGKKIRKGYLGHLVNIANKIAEREDPVTAKFKESNEAWGEFVKTQLASINEINSLNLG